MYKMFVFIKNVFHFGFLFFFKPSKYNSIKLISMNNQACKVRPEIINVNSNEPIFYPFSIETSKCSGSSNNINDPYAKIYFPDVVKDLNVKVINLMSRTNVTVNADWIQVFVIISNVGVMINAM